MISHSAFSALVCSTCNGACIGVLRLTACSSAVEDTCQDCYDMEQCTAECHVAACGADCDDHGDCVDYCSGNTRYYSGTCALGGACTCSFSNEDCGTDTSSSDSDGGIDYPNYGTCTTGTDYSCTPSSCGTDPGSGGGSDTCETSDDLREYYTSGSFDCTNTMKDCEDDETCVSGQTTLRDYNCRTAGGARCYYVDRDRDDASAYCTTGVAACTPQTWITSLGTGGDACCGNDGVADDWSTYSGVLTTSTSLNCQSCLNGADLGSTTRYGNGYFNDGGNLCYYGNIACAGGSSSDGTSETCNDACVDDNDGGSCTTAHTVSSAETCYWTDTCTDVTGCGYSNNAALRQSYCDTCGSSGVTSGNYCPPDGTLDDSGNLCWYNGAQSCTGTTCDLGTEACPDYCIDDNNGGSCAKTTHTIGTVETCYYTDTCGASTGCTLTSSASLLANNCDTCAAGGRTAGSYCPAAGTLSGTTCYYGTRTCTSTTCNLNTQGGIDYDTNTLTGDVCYWDANNNHCETASASETDTPCYAYCYDDDGTDGSCTTAHKTNPDSTASCYYNRGCGTSGCTHSSTNLRDDYCDICASGGRNDGNYCPAEGTWSGTTCYYGTHTCTSLTCNLDSGSTECSSGISTCCTDTSTIWESVSCNSATGPQGSSYDRDTSSVRCTSTESGCSAYNWMTNVPTSGTQCCGDDTTTDDSYYYSGNPTTATSLSCERCLDGSYSSPLTFYGNGHTTGSGTSRNCYYGNIACSSSSGANGTLQLIYGWGYYEGNLATSTSVACKSGAATCSDGSASNDTTTTLYGNGYTYGSSTIRPCLHGNIACSSGVETNGTSNSVHGWGYYDGSLTTDTS
ncbi:MAG: hypothetical protein KAS32_04310, partial [Candidatus Peribacteraceae bacterium]|nr:hypothetical protein [Candidatus Peribacteraceae bacterium]